MDLNQRKLTKSEWESIEVPVSFQEKDILNLITQGYHNVNIKYNKHNSLFQFLKIDYNETMEDHLYNKYFAPKINEMKKIHSTEEIFNVQSKSNPSIKKADIIRIEKNDTSKLNADIVYEYLLLNNIEEILKYKQKKNSKWLFYYFSLNKLIKNTISNLNRHVVQITNNVLSKFEEDVDMTMIIENSVDFIEKNDLILKYSDMTLYEHQKKIFNIMQNPDFVTNTIIYFFNLTTAFVGGVFFRSEIMKTNIICRRTSKSKCYFFTDRNCRTRKCQPYVSSSADKYNTIFFRYTNRGQGFSSTGWCNI